MFDTFSRLLGGIRVKEIHNVIYIDGLPHGVVDRDIRRIFSTSKISNFLFNRVTARSLSFNSFFAPDFAYLLDLVIKKQERNLSNLRALTKIRDLLFTETWLKRLNEPHPNILNFERVRGIDFTLKDHQFEFLRTYNTNVPMYGLRGYLLAAEPGTGKTVMGLALSLCLEADVTVIVAPKNAVGPVWEEAMRLRLIERPKFWSSLSGVPPKPGFKYYITHAEGLDRLLDFFREHGLKYEKSVLIIDESQDYNEIKSERTQKVLDLGKYMNCNHVLRMSGTPFKAIGSEAVPLLRAIDPLFDPNSEERFKNIYGKSASRALEILSNRIGLVSYKVSKEATIGNKSTTEEIKVKLPDGEKYTLDAIRRVMKDFIEERVSYYLANMSKYEFDYEDGLAHFQKTLHTGQMLADFNKYKEYIKVIRKGYDQKTMKNEVIYCNNFEKAHIIPSLPRGLKEDFTEARSVVKYYQLKVQGEAIGRILSKLRVQCSVEMVSHIGIEKIVDTAKKKTIIFTNNVETVLEADRYMKEKGFKPLLVYGDTNDQIESIVKTFYKDEDANPLIATFKSLSTAQTLICANTTIMIDQPWRDKDYSQAIARVDRMGQDSEVFVFNALLDTNNEPNISTRSADIMVWSRNQVAAIMGTSLGGDYEVALEDLDDMMDPIKYLDRISDKLPNQKPGWASWDVVDAA